MKTEHLNEEVDVLARCLANACVRAGNIQNCFLDGVCPHNVNCREVSSVLWKIFASDYVVNYKSLLCESAACHQPTTGVAHPNAKGDHYEYREK